MEYPFYMLKNFANSADNGACVRRENYLRSSVLSNLVFYQGLTERCLFLKFCIAPPS
jgi:hypothetical protein